MSINRFGWITLVPNALVLQDHALMRDFETAGVIIRSGTEIRVANGSFSFELFVRARQRITPTPTVDLDLARRAADAWDEWTFDL